MTSSFKKTSTLLIASHFLFSSETVNIEQMFDTCPYSLYTLGSWSSCKNCTIIDDYNKNCRLSNPCILHRGYAVQNKVIPVLKMFLTLTIDISSAPIVTMINVINRKLLILA